MKSLSQKETVKLLKTLEVRFKENLVRHEDLIWDKVLEKLEKYPEKLWSLHQMEITGGEPDVVDYDQENDIYFFYDCSPESPKQRRSICYDKRSIETIVQYNFQNSAVEIAEKMGIELLSKQEYEYLQKFGDFDTKTSSWLKTPNDMRKQGAAFFADFRYNQVFIYHNKARSFFISRGFRAVLKV